MSKKVKNVLSIVSLLLGIAAIVLILISMLREESSNGFLMTGMFCMAAGVVINTFFLRRKDKKDVEEN